MPDPSASRDNHICSEMMTHTPLFSHRHPHKVAVLDDENRGMILEILKHSTLTTIWQLGAQPHSDMTDSRVHFFGGSLSEFLAQAENDSLDILIVGSTIEVDIKQCMKVLHHDGIFVQLCQSSFDLHHLKDMKHKLKTAGFSDVLPLNFPQPDFTSGWRAAVMAVKQGTIRYVREKAVFNKTFSTRYYNLEMHKAAFAMPEFMREELV